LFISSTSLILDNNKKLKGFVKLEIVCTKSLLEILLDSSPFSKKSKTRCFGYLEHDNSLGNVLFRQDRKLNKNKCQANKLDVWMKLLKICKGKVYTQKNGKNKI